jgi:hypothetical protein
LKRKAAEAATTAIMGSKNALNKPTDDQGIVPKSAVTKTSMRKDTKSVIEKSPQTAANIAKREKEELKKEQSDKDDEEDEDDEEEEEEDEDMDEDLNDDDIEDEDGEEEDEEMEDEIVEDGNVNDLKLKKKHLYLKEQRIANRALRIKMGKSGAQAATRKNIKKGKDACQRKLWNQGVS